MEKPVDLFDQWMDIANVHTCLCGAVMFNETYDYSVGYEEIAL